MSKKKLTEGLIKEFKFRNARKSYRNYIKQYKKKRNYLADNYAYEMAVPMLNYREWKESYIALHNDQIMEVKAGIRKTTGAINQELVSKQAYEFSNKQAKKLYSILDKKDQRKTSITAIRIGEYDFTNYLNKYHELRSGPDAMSGKVAKNFMSWYFFGSE